jgi:hypothetical protein
MSLRTGEEIFSHSVAIARQHPRLLVFPLLIMATGLCIFAMLLPLIFHLPIHDVWNGLWHPRQDTEAMRALAAAIRHPLTLPWGWLVGGWLAGMFVVTFINAALYSEAIHALNGGAVSIRRGFSRALERRRALAVWALVASTFGAIVGSVDRVLGVVHILVDVLAVSWVMRRLTLSPSLFLGVPWTAAAQFVVPAINREPQTMNPLAHLKISVDMVRRVWGEALVVGFFGASGLGCYVAFGVLGFSMLAGSITHMDAPVVWGALLCFGIFCLTHGINGIYRCALYIYATEGIAPGPFDTELFNRAWSVR